MEKGEVLYLLIELICILSFYNYDSLKTGMDRSKITHIKRMAISIHILTINCNL